MKVRILLGVTDAGMVDALRTQLGELAGVEIVAVERSSNDVTGAVNSVPAIDVVLIDQNIAGLPAFDLIRDLTRRQPQLGLVLISADQSAETYHQAMSVGARGVISREPALSELQNRIEAAADWARSVKRHIDPARVSAVPGRSGRLVAVVGAKGAPGPRRWPSTWRAQRSPRGRPCAWSTWTCRRAMSPATSTSPTGAASPT